MKSPITKCHARERGYSNVETIIVADITVLVAAPVVSELLPATSSARLLSCRGATMQEQNILECRNKVAHA